MSTSPDRKTRPQHRSRKSHASRRHDTEPTRPIRRSDPRARSHVDVIDALEAIGWRVIELRPSLDRMLWHVAIERVDLVATMTVTALDLDGAFEELARYASPDAKRV